MHDAYLNNENSTPHVSQKRGEKAARNLGSIYTPRDFAQFLTSWAIQSHEYRILDVGVGEGVFVFTAYERLIELGAKEIDAQQQVYGAEIDHSTYQIFSTLASQRKTAFPHLYNDDFFNVEFPRVDAIVGNPPYVRRTYIENIEHIRQTIFKRNPLISEFDFPRMTDLYIYFLLHALPLLRPGGRLAVITADPWLNVGYGEAFKKYLHQHFKIESLISLEVQPH